MFVLAMRSPSQSVIGLLVTLSVGCLGALAGTHGACAEEGRGFKAAEEAPTATPSAVTVEIPSKVAALLATAERQVADGRVFSPPQDSAADTLVSVFVALPDASPSDMKLIRGIPSHFAERARAANAAGRREEAESFSLLAEVFTIPPEVAAKPTEQTLLGSGEANAVTHPSDAVQSGVEFNQPSAPPNEGAGAISKPDGADGPSRASAVTAQADATAMPGASSKIGDLLAKAEQQISDGHVWSPPNDCATDTFISMIAVIPGAPVSDLEIVKGIPSNFTKRADAALKAGRYEEAQAYLSWASIFASSQAPGTSPTEQAPLSAPPADTGLQADGAPRISGAT